MVKCFKCKHDIHLPCIGIACKAADICSPNLRFFCDDCLSESVTTNDTIDLNASTHTPSTAKGDRIKIRDILHEMNRLKSIVEENGKKLDSVDAKTTIICKSTDTLVNKALRPPLSSTPQMNPRTPNPHTPKNHRTSSHPIKSFADAARFGLPSVSGAKRKRSNDVDTVEVRKFDAPKPKVGTKKSNTNLSIVKPVEKPKPTEKKSFSRAIWISRFKPTTEQSEIVDYILAEIPVNDKEKFNVHKLVKKGADLTTMKFISFKIEVNDEEYNILNDTDMWPENVMVRPFIENQTLGNFLPSLNRKSETEQLTKDEMRMQTEPPAADFIVISE